MASISKEIKVCHLGTLLYKEEALGLPCLEPLTLNNEKHILLYILLDVNIEGEQDLYVFKIVTHKGIWDILVETSYPAHTIQC